ncbi:MAG: hypothetical protein ISR69_12735, partial [Gammaproteobacteria bacterium]|nr:hypothetical protein [Gammaproteobacteria bacterium]
HFVLMACSGSSQIASVSQQNGNLILTTSHGDGGSAWGLSECAGCHVLNSIHQQAETIRPIVQLKAYASCTGCHGSNGTQQSRACVLCHNPVDLPEEAINSAKHTHNFSSDSSVALTDEQCVMCHLASDMNGEMDINIDLTRYKNQMGLNTPYVSQVEFCLRCHNRDFQQQGFEINADYENPLIAMYDNYSFVDFHGEPAGTGERSYSGLRDGYSYASLVKCTDCHVMHGTDNTGLISDSSNKGFSQLESLIRNKPYSIDNVGKNNAQLCVVCHNMTVSLDSANLNVGNGLSGLHEIAGDCQTCHSHGEAVQAGM